MSYIGDQVGTLKTLAVGAFVASLPGYMGYGTVDGQSIEGIDRSATGYALDRGAFQLIVAPPDASGAGGARLLLCCTRP